MKILIITNLENECSIEDIWIANSFISDGHTVKLVNKYYDKSLEDEYDIFIKRYSWIEDIDDFSVGAEESDYETRILKKNLPRINFDGKFDNQGKHYLANLYNNGYAVVPTINNILELDKLGKHEKYLIKPVNGYASYGIIETDKSNINNYWDSNYVIHHATCQDRRRGMPPLPITPFSIVSPLWSLPQKGLGIFSAAALRASNLPALSSVIA